MNTGSQSAQDVKPLIFSNTGFLMLGVIANAIIGLYVTRILVRYLGVALYGQYALAFVYLNFTAVITNFGFDSILVREISRKPENTNSILTAGIVLKLVFATFAFALGGGYVLWRGYDSAYTWAVLFLLLTHYVSAFESFEIVYKSRLRGGNVAISSVLSQLFILGCVLWARAHGWPLGWLIATNFFGRLLRVLYLVFRLRTVSPFRWTFSPSLARFILAESATVGLTGILWVVYFRVDILMLEWLKGVEAVAQYAAAYKFVDLALLGSGLVMSSLSPLLSRRWPDEPGAFRWMYQQTIDYMAIIGAAAACFMVVLGPDLIRNLYSVYFTDAIAILRILSIATVIVFISNALGHTMVAVGVQGPGLATTRVVGAALNIVLNLWWIPRWGGYGAAWATVASEGAVLLIAPFFIWRRVGYLPRLGTPVLGIVSVWAAWRAYLAAGGGRVEANWPGRGAGLAVICGMIALFVFAHRKQFRELFDHFRSRG